jgi:hypothetical protein
VQHSTRFACVYALFLLLPVHNTRAQALQTDELAIAAAKELAETYSKANVPFLPGRLRELYVDVATPIFARRLAAEDIRFLTDEFKAPVFQALTTALAESLAMIMPCLQSNLDALPKLQEPPAEERSRLARQLWAIRLYPRNCKSNLRDSRKNGVSAPTA